MVSACSRAIPSTADTITANSRRSNLKDTILDEGEKGAGRMAALTCNSSKMLCELEKTVLMKCV